MSLFANHFDGPRTDGWEAARVAVVDESNREESLGEVMTRVLGTQTQVRQVLDQIEDRIDTVIVAAVDALDAIDVADPDAAHSLADKILLDSVYPEIAEAYREVMARADWWANA